MKIIGWAEHFENHDSRKLKALSWIKVPVKHDGLGFRRLLSEADGLALFGAWVLIVQVAAKCPERGVLRDSSGRDLGPQELALKTGGASAVFARAIPILAEIGWIEVQNTKDTPSERAAGDVEKATTAPASRGEKPLQTDTDRAAVGVEKAPNSPGKTGAVPSILTFECIGKGPKTWDLTQALVDEYVVSYPGVDVVGEFRKAWQWLRSNPAKRKTAGGMRAYLTKWLNRCVDRGHNGNGTSGRSAEQSGAYRDGETGKLAEERGIKYIPEHERADRSNPPGGDLDARLALAARAERALSGSGSAGAGGRGGGAGGKPVADLPVGQNGTGKNLLGGVGLQRAPARDRGQYFKPDGTPVVAGHAKTQPNAGHGAVSRDRGLADTAG